MGMALCRVDSCEDRLQQARLTVEDLYQVLLTLQSMQVFKEVELKGYIDEMLEKFPEEITQAGH